MKIKLLGIVVLLAQAWPGAAQTNAVNSSDAEPLPTMDFLAQKVTERAVNDEDKNDNLFDMNYQYTRSRVWEYRNSKGKVVSHEEKRSVENKPERIAARNARLTAANKPVPPSPPSTKEQAISETHSNIRGKALKVKDYSIPNLMKRFKFTLVGRDELNGRPSYVVDFVPKSKDLPVNGLADKFINKAAGRFWVDAEDYAISQAQLRLTEQVNILGGIVGSIWKFNYAFTRLRTPEGFWFARHMDWHLEGREVVFNRIVDYHEQKMDPEKIIQTADAK